MLSELQKKKLVHQFHVMDLNGSGHLDWDDHERIAGNIAAARGHAKGSEGYESIVGAFRHAWDQAAPFHDDGVISESRWLEYQDHLLGSEEAYDEIVRQTAEAIFDMFDLDGDERVSIEEWRGFFRCYGIDEGHADECFPRYDANGDGYVSRSELVELVREFYLGSDPDAAGNLLYGPLS